MLELSVRQLGWSQLTSRSSALFLADVDGDGKLEIIVAQRDGQLEIFSTSTPQNGHFGVLGNVAGLGLVSTLCIGNLFHSKPYRPIPPPVSVICVNGNFTVYTFLRSNEHKMDVEVLFHQLLLSNIQTSVIADIDGDGREELLVGLTDRVVRSYRFLPDVAPVRGPRFESPIPKGKLVPLNKWEVPAQILCLALSVEQGNSSIYVSQPGGGYIRLKPSEAPGDSEWIVEFFLPLHVNEVKRNHIAYITEHVVQASLFHAMPSEVVLVSADATLALEQSSRVRFLKLIFHQQQAFAILLVNCDGLIYLFRRLEGDAEFPATPSAKANLNTDVASVAVEYSAESQRILLALANQHKELGLVEMSLKG